MRVKLSRRARWAVPGMVIAVTAAVIAITQIPSAQAAPVLPVRTPAQLLAEISNDAKLPPLTGTVVESTDLGLPQLPDVSNPTSLSALLTGNHTMKVYYQDATHYRLAIPQPQAETDIIRNGDTVWQWESTSDSVTEYTLPKPTAEHPASPPTGAPLTPQQAANQVLAVVGKTTLVSVQANVVIAGEPAYQLVLAPKDSRSLVGQVTIAIDATYGLPLRVQVFAKGGTSPAFQVGYTDLQFTAPSPANFDFTPPPGATLKKETLGSTKQTGANGRSGTNNLGAGFGTYGSNWLTVVELPSADLISGLTGGGRSGSPLIGSSSQAAPGETPDAGGGPAGVMAGDSQAVLNAILGSAKPVHGSWGSGTLVTTSLVSILTTGNEVYIGAVQPSVLYAAVGHTSS